MSEHVFDYDAWAVEMRDALPEHTWLGVYMAIKDVMHRRKREPIVRCRDCKYFTANKEFWIEPPKVPFPMIGATSDCCDFWAGTECKVTPDGFCAWGERRDA